MNLKFNVKKVKILIKTIIISSLFFMVGSNASQATTNENTTDDSERKFSYYSIDKTNLNSRLAVATTGTISLDESNYPISLRAPRKYLTIGGVTYPASCFTPEKGTPYPGTTFIYQSMYTADTVQRKIFYFGYPANDYMWRNYGISAADALYYTQAASWIEANYASSSHQTSNSFLNDLLIKARNSSIPSNASRYISLSATDVQLTKQTDGTQISGYITVNSNTTGEVNISTANGIHAIDSNGTQKTKFLPGEKFKIVAPSTFAGSMNVQFSGKYQNEEMSLWSSGNSSYQQMILPLKIYTNTTLTVKITGQDGKFTVIKKGEFGDLLPGVKFNLYTNSACTTLKGSYVTDSNGKFTIDNIVIGTTYYLKETATIEGYNLDSTVRSIQVPVGSTTSSLTITNTANKGRCIIYKRNKENYSILPGAEFIITSDFAGKNIVDTGITDSRGQLIFSNLDFDVTYYVREINPPDGGYIMDTTLYSVVTSSSSKTCELTIYNTPYTSVVGVVYVGKKDATSAAAGITKLVPGAMLEIGGVSPWLSDYKKIITTSDTATLISGLYYGQYYVREVSPPGGYVKSDEIVYFEIDENAGASGRFPKNVYFSNERIKSQINIIKKDSKSNQPIKGAKFQITGTSLWENNISKIVTTDESGNASILLDHGDYVVKEIEAAEGYVLNSTEKSFKVLTTESMTFNFTNDRIKGTVSILKIDNKNNTPLAGATLTVSGTTAWNEDFHQYFTSTTLPKQIELEYGEYRITEVSAPTGYVQTYQVVTFKIDTNGQVKQVNVGNDRITSTISIIKQGSDSPRPIPGAKIKISGTNLDGYFETQITTKDTPEEIILEYGTYNIQEIEAPEGYILNNSIQSVRVTQNNEYIPIIIYNQRMKGTLNLTKTSDETTVNTNDPSKGNIPLRDAKIGIYNLNKELIGTVITNDQGKASIDLYYGKYYYKELKAPANYELDDTFYEFSITRNGEIVEKTLKNKLKPKSEIPIAGGINTVAILVFSFIGIASGISISLHMDRKKD